MDAHASRCAHVETQDVDVGGDLESDIPNNVSSSTAAAGFEPTPDVQVLHQQSGEAASPSTM